MTKKSVGKKIILLIGSLAVCILAGYLTLNYFMPGMPEWYDGLVKPVYSQPAWLFSPLWMASFVLMGIILALILLAESDIRHRDILFGLNLFGFQILFVLVWAFAFFALHQLFISFICIIAVWATLLSTVIHSFRFSVRIGLLFIPYFLWVCYLVYLNYGLMTLNNAVHIL
jgi:tryptophan-rich sensory protein